VNSCPMMTLAPPPARMNTAATTNRMNEPTCDMTLSPFLDVDRKPYTSLKGHLFLYISPFSGGQVVCVGEAEKGGEW